MMLMELKAFLDRTGRTKAGLLRELSRDPKSSLISSYIKGRSYPSFEIVLKLIELGITDDELFGKKYAAMLRANSQTDEEKAKSIFESPQFREEVEKILAEIKAQGVTHVERDSGNFLDSQIEEGSSDKQ